MSKLIIFIIFVSYFRVFSCKTQFYSVGKKRKKFKIWQREYTKYYSLCGGFTMKDEQL